MPTPVPTQEMVDAVVAKLLEYLSKTPYACTSLEQLSTRPANYVFRGKLAQPITEEDATTSSTVIVKHTTERVDPRRHAFEQALFDGLADPSSASILSPSPSVVIKSCPKLYIYELQPFYIQVSQDFCNTTAVKWTVFSPNADQLLPQPDTPALLGRHLGSWFRAFHTWASAPAQQSLRAKSLPDDPERKRKRAITYQDFISVLEGAAPALLKGHRETLEEVSRVRCAEFDEEPALEGGDELWGIIHADTWTGNFLLPTTGWNASPSPSNPNRLFIIDWEYAQWGSRAIDLGQLVGDLSERILFNKADTSLAVVQAIIKGYGKVSDEMAFRTAVHAGVHVIRALKRNLPKTGRWAATDEEIAEGLEVARDWVLRGWARDRAFFKGSVLEGLFY